MLGELYAVVKEGNKQAKIGASKFRQILNDIIERLRKLFNSLTGKQKAEVKADIDELTRLRDIFESAMVAGVKKNAEIARKTKNLEIKTNKEYNGNVKYSAKALRGRTIEIETMENNRFERLRQFHGDLPAQWFAFTGDYFYLYSNESQMDYTILIKARITLKNKPFIDYFIRRVEDGTYGSGDVVNRWIGHFRRGKGRYSWNPISIRRGRTKNRVDGVDGESSGNNRTRSEDNIGYTGRGGSDSESNIGEEDAFNLKQPVEETKDLVAMHNMSEQQLLDVLTRGQFIMPSVAVTNKGLEAFGDISVLFNKDTIDPNQNENNKLYGSDAWTPTQTELKKNPKFDDKATANALRGIRKTLGDFAPQIFKDNSALFKQNIAKADGSVYNAYAHNVGMQAAYAMESGLISAIPKDANGNVNTKKLQSQLDAVLDKDSEWRKYERWLSDISNKIITSYDKASNEDILRDMKSQPDYAKKFRLSMDGELTAPVVEYSSVEEFRSNKARLSETAEQDAASLGKEFLQWAKTIPGAKMRDVVNAINSTFDSRYSGKDIVKAFADKGITISAKRADSLQSLYKKAVELSTPYFEAKPQRGVGVNEIAAVVLPSNARAELVSKLRETGVNILTYNKGNSADRVNKVNSVENVKFSLKNGEDTVYTEEEYRDYGWARADDFLNEGESEDFKRKFAQAKSGQQKFNKTKNREDIIPVSDIYSSFFEGINNTLVFAKGTIDKPVITSIIKILEYDETTLDTIRRDIYELARRGLQPKTGDIVRRYYAFDFGTPERYRAHIESRRNDNGDGIGVGNSRESSSNDSGIGKLEGNFSLKGVNDLIDIRYSLKGVNVSGVSLQTIAEVRKAAAEGDVDTLSKYVERGLISTEFYNQLIEEYGAITKGEKPYRDIEVPQKTEKDKKVSQTVRTILEAKATPDEAVPTIQKMVEDGVFSYDAYTDKEAIAKTEEKLREHGWKDSYKNWMNAVNKGEVSKDITAMGWALYNNAANTAASTTSETERRDAIQTSLEVLDAMVRHQRSAASTTTQQWQISRLKKAGRFSKQSRWNGQEKNNKGTEKSVPLFSF